MPESFQSITLLLIESIYFAGIKVKSPHTSVWIIPSKFQFHRTSGKHVQISNSSDLWEACPNFKPSDLWEARPKFNFSGPLGRCPNSISMDLWEAHPNSNPSDLWEARPKSNHWTFGKHVQISNPSDLWKARPKIKIHQTTIKHVLYLFFYFLFFKKEKKKCCMHELHLDLILPLRGT